MLRNMAAEGVERQRVFTARDLKATARDDVVLIVMDLTD